MKFMTTNIHPHEYILDVFVMQEKLHSKTDAAFDRYRKAAQDTINKPSSSVPTNAQVRSL